MIKRRFPIVLFLALVLMSGSLHAMAVASSVTSYGYDEGKKDDPPRPRPPRGPRDGDDDN